MDFPERLSLRPNWVYDIDEVKQNVTIILRNHLGDFLQSPTIGARFDVHSVDDELLDEGIRQTFTNIPYVTLKKININLPEIELFIEYNGEDLRLKYKTAEI